MVSETKHLLKWLGGQLLGWVSFTTHSVLFIGGIGAVILGANSGRVVPMSSTPFINSTQDLATSMALIDPKMKSSYKTWWKQATKRNADKTTVEEVSRWRKYFLVGRQRDILCNELPEKSEIVISVDCFDSELHDYKRYETHFVSAFERYKNSTDPGLTLGKKDITSILLMYLINMVRTWTPSTLSTISFRMLKNGYALTYIFFTDRGCH